MCRGTACHVKQSLKLAQHLTRKLNLKPNGNSPDNKFTVITVACLGACSIAPVIKLDGEFYGHLDVEKLDRLLDEAAKERPCGASNLISPCCDRCTHRPGSPCRDLVRAWPKGPICHSDDACAKTRQERAGEGKRGGQGTLIFVGAGTCGRANGSTKVIASIGAFLQEHKIAAEIVEVGCVGYCQRELFVDVQKPGEPGWPTPTSIQATSTSARSRVRARAKCATASSTAATATPAPNWADVPEINTTDFFKRR
jgi:predicted metal-binding protein